MGSWTIESQRGTVAGSAAVGNPMPTNGRLRSTTGTTERDRGVGGRFDRTARPIVGNERQLVGNRGTACPPVLASSRATLVHLLSRLRFSAAGTRRFAERRVGVLRRLRGHRVMGGLLAGFVFAVASSIQSGVVCPDAAHGVGRYSSGGGAAAPHHHMSMHHDGGSRALRARAGERPADAPIDAAGVPLCCMALAGCAAPGSPAPRTSAGLESRLTSDVPLVAAIGPRLVAFEPETPPPRA